MRQKPALTTIKNRLQSPDLVIIIAVILFIAFGVLMVFDASVVEAYHQIGDQWYFIKNQSKFALIGLVAALITYVFPLKKVEKLAVPIMLSALFFLVIVLIPGVGTKVQGARRWLDIGPVNFQPSEYAKLAAILYLSAWFSKPRPARSFIVFIGALIGLIIIEPDLGTALVICGISAVMYFLSGAPLKKIIKIISIAVIGITMLIALAPYRLNRIKTFFNPNHDPLGVSYHARQVLISLGSGGVMGTGLGKSRQKYQYLPEASTDSIFAVIGEELGFVGGSVVIIAYVFLILRMYVHAHSVQDLFIRNVLSGIASWLAIQVILNLMAMIGIVPLTGIPLPLISYGGSSLVMCLAGLGFAVQSSRYRLGERLHSDR